MNPELARLLLAPETPAPSPCFVIDVPKLRANAAILADVQARTGARILLALKGYAAWSTFGVLSATAGGPLYGTCASSVDEARLGKEEFGGETHAFAAAWSDAEMAVLLRLCDHITFNSLSQWRRFRPVIEMANSGPRRNNPIRAGLRINPEHSEGTVAIYDPCAPGSRLGIRKKALPEQKLPPGITGLHFHTLCEQNADALERTLAAFEQNFGSLIAQCSWLNWGGGHHITRPDYDIDLLVRLIQDWQRRYGCQIYLEPGEAVALDAGWLTCTVLDIVEADMPIALLDTSAACHMPDVLEMPYTPAVWQWLDNAPARAASPCRLPWTCRIGGKSCLAGDVIGEYSFDRPLKPGDRLAFADMAIYSMVKTTTFNGLRLPAIALFDDKATPDFQVIREFGYQDFKGRLS